MIRRGFLEHSPQALAGILSLALAKIPDIGSIAPALRKITIPTLVIVGGDDERSLDASRTLASSMPNSRLAIIEGASHVVNLSQPGAFNQELAQFLASLASGSPDNGKHPMTKAT
jgi:pimeloyl-ACP methyl ester carboxylesterase